MPPYQNCKACQNWLMLLRIIVDFKHSMNSNLHMNGYNGTQSLKAPSNNKYLLKIKPGKNYQRCIWCINYGAQQELKKIVGCNSSTEQPIPSSLEPEQECNFDSSRSLEVWKLYGDECLDFFMPVKNRSPYQILNNVINNEKNSEAM